MITRDNFDSAWLALATQDTSHKKFRHSSGRELKGARPAIKGALKQAVVDHHKHAEVVAKLLEKYGFKKASQLLSSQLPRSHRTRMGNFGEVISSEHLRQRYGYAMPVFKLRYTESFLLPARGEDVLCFEMGKKGRVLSLCLAEAKTLASYRASAVAEAHERLKDAFNPFPVALSLIANILYERGDNDLADQVVEIIALLSSRPFACKNWIFIISGNEPSNPFNALEQESQIVKDLSCVDIFLPDLQQLVNEIFDSPLAK